MGPASNGEGPESSPGRGSPLWAIAAYFNPLGSVRRRANYAAFRRNLAAPLLTVELAAPGRHELGEGAAETIIRLEGDGLLWQKERLLNIAIAALPASARYVAWLDCDVLFSDDGWLREACTVLEARDCALTLYDTVHHLPPGFAPAAATRTNAAATPPRIVQDARIARHVAGDVPWDQVLSSSDWNKGATARHTPGQTPACGLAIAARRQSIAACGLYEAMVVGGGDLAFHSGIQGAAEAYVSARRIGAGHGRHYMDWAERAAPCFADGQAVLRRTLHHLWHGNLDTRKYGAARQEILLAHGFEPERDLLAMPGRPLAWRRPGTPLARDVAEYFKARRAAEEDVDEGT